MEWRRDGYLISTDPARLDREAIWRFLRTAYWSPNVPRAVVERSIEHSLVFGLYAPDSAQAGFARAVTDQATFAWLGDVFVLEPHRGRGLGVWLVETILSHPDLRRVRRFMLATADAHGLYRRFGFEQIDPERMMERSVAAPADITSVGPPRS
jgi:GNAT superfamily N-acetyltransferase